MSTKSAAAKDEALVSGVKVELVKIALVNKALKDADVEIGEMNATEKVEALQLHFRKLPTGKKSTCTKCGGVSNIELDACPFCGDEGEDDEPVTKSTPPTVATVTSIEKAKKDKTSTKMVKAPMPSTATRVAVAPSVKVEISEKALDLATKHILEIKERSQRNYWDLGQAILHVYSTQLWKTRRKGTKVAYTSFNQYAEEELFISRTSAFNMMDIGKYFTEAQVKKIGGSKLSLILKAPEIERPALMKEVEKGTSHRNLAKKVKKARKKHKIVKRDTGRKKIAANKTQKQAAKSSGRLTVATTEGVKTFELWAKPASKLKEGEKPTKRAKTLNDEPWAIEKMDNGVERVYSIVGSSNGWKLKITTRRH